MADLKTEVPADVPNGNTTVSDPAEIESRSNKGLDSANPKEAATATKDEASELVETTSPEAKAEDPSVPPSEGKKRKYAEAENERDWRTRREEDRGRDRHGRANKHSTNKRHSKPFKDYNENVKSNFLSRPESSDPDEIRKQVEFYFSDSNLPTDKFLLQQTGGPENKPVPIKVIHSFKRMRHFQPFSAVVAALKDSDILVVNGNEEVSRKDPLPEGMEANADANSKLFEDKARPRSIYAKGFGEEGPNTQFDIEAFFAPYGPTNAIRLRRSNPEKVFKGSVFVEFDSEETAKQFLALENKPKFDGRDLLIMSKEDYINMKAKELAKDKTLRGEFQGRGGTRGGSRGGHGQRGGHRGGRAGFRANDSRRDDKPHHRRAVSGNEDEDGERPKKRERENDDDTYESIPDQDTSSKPEAKRPKVETNDGE